MLLLRVLGPEQKDALIARLTKDPSTKLDQQQLQLAQGS